MFLKRNNNFTVDQNLWMFIIIIIIDNRGLNARWCLTPLLLSRPTAAYLGQRGLTPAGLPHTTAQRHLTILREAVLFCLNHPSFRTPRSLSFCCRSFYRYGRRGATFSVSLLHVELSICTPTGRRRHVEFFYLYPKVEQFELLDSLGVGKGQF